MNPIPLKGPRGRIYAYACGTCGQVPHVGEIVFVPNEEERSDLIKRKAPEYKAKAAACCVCRRCKAPLAPSERHVNEYGWETVSLGARWSCAPCEVAERNDRHWHWFIGIWRQIGEAMSSGISTVAQWNARFDKDDE